MYREERERWARNIAESIDDVYARALVPEQLGSRQRQRRVDLVARQIFHVLGLTIAQSIKRERRGESDDDGE